MIQQETFEIWNDKFSVKDAKSGWIFKIYFKNFPMHCYIGITSYHYTPSIKLTLKSFKGKLFKSFSGISPYQLLSQEYLLNEKEYQALSKDQRESYNRKIGQKRQAKLLEFEQDKLPQNEWKYWKMMMFMEMNHLQLHDLRIELLVPESSVKNRDEFLLKRLELINKENSYVEGFNSMIMIDHLRDQEIEWKTSEPLNLMKKLFQTSKNQYLRWNTWWNLYQTFKLSFSQMTLIWMDFWNQVTVPQLTEDFKAFTRYLFQNKNTAKLPNLNYFPPDMINYLKKYPHPNAQFFLNNHRTALLKNRIKIDEWIANDAQFFLMSSQVQLIEEREFLQFYGSWEEIQSFFKVTPLNHPSGFKNEIQPIFETFIKQSQELKDFKQALWKYNWFWRLTDSSYYSNVPSFVENDLLFDYYFTLNFLNSIVFENE